jgi:hypothetical protein
MSTLQKKMKTNTTIAIVLASILLAGCEPHENTNVENTFAKSKETSTRTEDGMKGFLGKWQNKEKAILLEITSNGFHYISSSESIDITGQIHLWEDRLLVGRPEEDGGYVVLTDQGTLLLKQEKKSEWELELIKVKKGDEQLSKTQLEITEKPNVYKKHSMSITECAEQQFKGVDCQEHKEWLYGN